jgi:phenylpropionate dioxygenase-like ring-hydroxylating dioxygenase large terminal subunit
MDVLESPAIDAGAGQTSVAPTGRFLRNTWYPILWSSDLEAGALVSRVALEEPIVFFRKSDGTPAAVADVCSHRFAPLHLGKLCDGDRIRCGYHGLEFGADGACARNPYGDGRIPAAASIRAYPLLEKHRILWIWMGTRRSEPAAIPDFSIFDRPAPGTLTKFDSITMQANYELIVDNLMDLNHTAFLHEGLLGDPAMTQGSIDVRQDGNTVYVERFNRSVPAVEVYDLLFRQDGKPFDFWDTMRWDAPGSFLLDTGVHEPGASKDKGTGIFAVHLLTPETATSTNYLFSAVRQGVANGQPPTPEIAAKIGELRRHIFQSQDTVMIEAQQRVLTRFPQYTKRAALFSIDAGPARYKRVLRALLDADPEAALK